MSKKRISREVRVGAMADYLIGKMKVTAIAEKWGVSHPMISVWAHAISDHFKTRHPSRRKKNDQTQRRYLEAA